MDRKTSGSALASEDGQTYKEAIFNKIEKGK